MEVYLNIAEWGPGIFGVEAASQFHFNKRAGRINEREAARLAVALPNPFMRDAGEPGPGTMRLAAEIQSRMHAASASQTACILKGD
jgi:monofunctional biosynthetic peptidoglycan transglycosylase